MDEKSFRKGRGRMSVIISKEVSGEFEFDYEKLINEVIEASIEYINCPYECMVEVDIVNNDEIQDVNREFREIDKPTDVLSFPLVEYEKAGDFTFLEKESSIINFEPDSGELVLGNIILSYDKILSQSAEYGHGIRREMAFLVAHSMLHLFGFDHIEEDERKEMERMQEEILVGLNILR